MSINSSQRRFPGRQRQRGAVLLLLIMVMGLAASSLLVAAFNRPADTSRQQAQTRAAMAAAKDALIGYAVIHRRLPRPAISATDGHESTQPCADESACTGFLPWMTLGLAAGDGWGKLLRYSVSPDYANAPVDQRRPAATKTVLDRAPDGTWFYRAGTDNCYVDDRCSPAVILSSGRHLGVSVAGITQASDIRDNEDEQINEAATKDFIARTATDDPRALGGSFSNAVSWIPLTLIRNRIRATAPKT